MTVARTIGVLGLSAAILLLVVILRTEAAGVHYQISQIDRELDGLRQQFRENDIEIARLRNPALIRASAALQITGPKAHVRSAQATVGEGGR